MANNIAKAKVANFTSAIHTKSNKMIAKNNFVSVPQNFDEPKNIHMHKIIYRINSTFVIGKKTSSNSLLDQHREISKEKFNRNQLYTLKTCNMTITFLKYI